MLPNQVYVLSILGIYYISLLICAKLDGEAAFSEIGQLVIEEIIWDGRANEQMEIKVCAQSPNPITIIHCEVLCIEEEGESVTRRSFWQEESPREINQGQYKSTFYFTPFGDVTIRTWAVDEAGKKTSTIEKIAYGEGTKNKEETRNFESQKINEKDQEKIEIIERDIESLKEKRNIDESNIDKQIGNYVEQNQIKEDKKKPVIKIEGVKPYANQREAVSIIVTLEDENLDLEQSIVSLIEETKKQKVEATYRRENISKLELEFYNINQDGKYKIKVIAKDKFGNEERKTLSFFLNQTGTKFKVQSDIEPYMNHIPSIKILLQNQKNVSIISCLVNGKNAEYEYKNKQVTLNSSDEDLWRDGRKNITLTVRDSAGNINQMPPLRFILDRLKPEWEIEGIQEGGIYYSEREIKISLKDSSDQILAILLNGQEIEDIKGKTQDIIIFTVGTYGKWELKLKAKDRAGNYSEVNTCFWIKPYNPVERQELSFSHICYFLSILLFVVEVIIFGVNSICLTDGVSQYDTEHKIP